MGKRKERQQKKSSVVCEEKEEEARFDDEEIEEQGEEGSRFFGCYLLTSLCPRFKGHTYIGFTVNPGRRIRQHNGEIRMGAWRTKRKRPWEMVLCIYGFPTNVSALQFEWAWQHPVESRAVRQAAASFKSFGGVANKIKMAYTMLTLPAWESLNLTVNFFSTKYKKHSAGCPSLPQHMKVQVCALDELPCYTGIDVNDCTNDDWGNSEEFDGSSQKLTEEGSVESPVPNSSAGNRYSTEENVREHIDWREESIDEQAEENSTTNKEDRKELHLLYESPVKASYSIRSGSYDKVDNFEDNVHEHIDLREESIDQQAEENTTNTKECHLLNDSPLEASFSIQSGSYDTVDNFEAIWELDIEVGGKPRRPTNKQRSTKVVADQDPSPSKREGLSCEVEVIDLFTPPCFKANPDSKRRRPSNACPHIIDLTESPIFV